MKYNIFVSIFVFLLLSACNPDFSTKQKDTKHQSNIKGSKSKTEVVPKQDVGPRQKVGPSKQEEDINREIKNKLIDDLRNLIEVANMDKEKDIKKLDEEPQDQYGISIFKIIGWLSSPGERISDNTERSKTYRRRVYGFLNAIDTNEFKKFSEIIRLSALTESILNSSNTLGGFYDRAISRLYSKKVALDKLDISDLKKLKNSLEKLFPTKLTVANMFKQLLSDYQNDKNLIKTDATKLSSHVEEIHNQF
ncbi:virulence associated lipoprotein, partial [Borreliella americana]